MKKILMLLAINSLFVTTYSNVVSCLTRSKFKKTDLPDSETAGSYMLIVNDETIKEQMTQYLIDYYNSNSGSTEIKDLGNGIDISATNNTGADATNSKPLKGIEYTIKIKVEFSNRYYNAGNITVDRAPLEKINIPNDADYTYSLKEDDGSIKTQIMAELLDYYKTETSSDIKDLGVGINISSTPYATNPKAGQTYTIKITSNDNHYYNDTTSPITTEIKVPTNITKIDVPNNPSDYSLNPRSGTIQTQINNELLENYKTKTSNEISSLGSGITITATNSSGGGSASDTPVDSTTYNIMIKVTTNDYYNPTDGVNLSITAHNENDDIISKIENAPSEISIKGFNLVGDANDPKAKTEILDAIGLTHDEQNEISSLVGTLSLTDAQKVTFYVKGESSTPEKSVKLVGQNDSLKGKSVYNTCIATIKGKTVFYAGTGSGLYESTDGEEYIKTKVHAQVCYILQAKSGAIYVATYDGLFMSNDDGGTFTQIAVDTIRNYTVLHLFQAQDGTIYAGTYDGLYESTDSENVFVKTSWVEKSYCMTEADNGDILVGTNEGLYKSSDGKTFNITSDGSNGIQKNAVQAITKAQDGTIYAGTNKGLYKSSDDGSTFNKVPISGTDTGIVFCFYIFNNVYYLSTQTKLYTSSNGTDYTAIANNQVIDIKELNNILYFSTGKPIALDGEIGLWYYSA